MPLYEYRCDECATRFEQRRSMADADKAAVCPVCASLLTQRLFSVIAVLGSSRPLENALPKATQNPHRAGCACCIPLRR